MVQNVEQVDGVEADDEDDEDEDEEFGGKVDDDDGVVRFIAVVGGVFDEVAGVTVTMRVKGRF